MTIFMVRDARVEDPKFRVVPRSLYKKMARIHDESGQPLLAETEYRNGMPFKMLTLLSDGIERDLPPPRKEGKRKWVYDARRGVMIRRDSEGKEYQSFPVCNMEEKLV